MNALESLVKLRKEDYENGNFHLDRHCCYAVIQKSLQALEIMLEKEVNIQSFKSALSVGWDYELFEKHCLDNFEYEDDAPYVHSMTKEQFELVKEELL